MTVGGTAFTAGVILFPLPVPFGLPVMLIGLSIMFKTSNKVKRTVIRLFKKNRHSERLWCKGRQLHRRLG